MDQTSVDINTALQLAHDHSWVAMALVLIGLAIRISKSDRAVKWFPVQIAPRWRAWASLVLGVAYGILHKLASGGTWGEAIVGGFIAGGGPILGHELIIESLRQGRDVGMSKDDAPPPPPRQPPVSMKPPPTLMLLLLLVSCGAAPVPVVVDEGLAVMNSGACKDKGQRISSGPGSCPDKRARLEQLVRYDADCIGLYPDAGPLIHCREDDAGGGADR